MIQGSNRRREYDSSLSQSKPERGEAKLPFHGFTSTYKQLNEQDMLEKKRRRLMESNDKQQHLDRYAALSHIIPPSSSVLSANRIQNPDMRAESIMTPVASHSMRQRQQNASSLYGGETDNRLWNSAVSDHKHDSQRWKPSDELRENVSSINNGFNNYNPNQSNINNFGNNQNEFSYHYPQYDSGRHTRDEQMYRHTAKINTDGASEIMSFTENPNVQTFREQCRKSYVKATAERQRNAELGMWNKCHWATYASGSGNPDTNYSYDGPENYR